MNISFNGSAGRLPAAWPRTGGDDARGSKPGDVAPWFECRRGEMIGMILRGLCPGAIFGPIGRKRVRRRCRAQPAVPYAYRIRVNSTKPTWHGFLDTTKDAMTIVDAAMAAFVRLEPTLIEVSMSHLVKELRCASVACGFSEDRRPTGARSSKPREPEPRST
jgi:hypothetical protein